MQPYTALYINTNRNLSASHVRVMSVSRGACDYKAVYRGNRAVVNTRARLPSFNGEINYILYILLKRSLVTLLTARITGICISEKKKIIVHSSLIKRNISRLHLILNHITFGIVCVCVLVEINLICVRTE